MPRIPHYPIATLGSVERLEVKGGYYRRPRLQAMFATEQARDNQEFHVNVTLVPEPDNPYSALGTAVSVRYKDRVIGYLPDGQSVRFAQLRRVAASGYDAATQMRVWTHKTRDGQRDFWMSLELPHPDYLLPLNDPPADGFVILPTGTKVQVTKESDHADYLTDFVPPSGKGQILVSLHRFETGKTKTWEAIEVRLDGERIGELSKVSSEKFIPTVRHFDDVGLTTMARATIEGSSIAAEVTLYAAKAFEVDEELLETEETNPLPRLVSYSEDWEEYETISRYEPDPVSKTPSGDQTRSATMTSESQAENHKTHRNSTGMTFSAENFYARTAPNAWAMWALTGPLGGHRYYLGKPKSGALMTLTLGGLGVWWVADALLLPKMRRDYLAAK